MLLTLNPSGVIMIVTEFDEQKINDEILNFLRYSLNSLDSKTRNVEKVKIINTINETLTYTISTHFNYVKSVYLDETLLTFGKDYDILWTESKIELFENPGVTTLTITYGENPVGKEGNFVYPDFPSTSLSYESYPRVGFKISFDKTEAGLGNGQLVMQATGLLQIICIEFNTVKLNALIKQIETSILTNYKNFQYVRYIRPTTITNVEIYNDSTNKLKSKLISFEIVNKIQVI